MKRSFMIQEMELVLVEKRKDSTVDRNFIYIPESMSVLETFYENGNHSLNAKRLQMIYTLNSLLDDKRKSKDYVLSHYNFNTRNCDLVKQKVKK